MMYQAVVILILVGQPSPMQVDAGKRSSNLGNCFIAASLLLTELVKTSPLPIISAQGFCLTDNALKKKDKMQPKINDKKENTREQII